MLTPEPDVRHHWAQEAPGSVHDGGSLAKAAGAGNGRHDAIRTKEDHLQEFVMPQADQEQIGIEPTGLLQRLEHDPAAHAWPASVDHLPVSGRETITETLLQQRGIWLAHTEAHGSRAAEYEHSAGIGRLGHPDARVPLRKGENLVAASAKRVSICLRSEQAGRLENGFGRHKYADRQRHGQGSENPKTTWA